MGASPSVNYTEKGEPVVENISKAVIKLFEKDLEPKMQSGELDQKDVYDKVEEIILRSTSFSNAQSKSNRDLSVDRSAGKYTSDDFKLGDIVRVNSSEAEVSYEGIVLDIHRDDQALTILYNDKPFLVSILHCTRIAKSTEFEVGDKVEVRPPGTCLFFVGFIKAINPGGTVDVVMEGEDPDDIEKGISIGDDIRKLVPKRLLEAERWRKAFKGIQAFNRFQQFKNKSSQVDLASAGSTDNNNMSSVVTSTATEGGEGGGDESKTGEGNVVRDKEVKNERKN